MIFFWVPGCNVKFKDLRNLSLCTCGMNCNRITVWKLPNQSVFLSARSPTGGCTGPYPVEFWISPGACTAQSSWETYSSVRPNHGKKHFSYDEMNFLVFQFVSLDSCPVSGYHWEVSVSIDFFTFAYQKFMHMDKIPLSSLFSKLENTNSLCLSLLLSLSPCSI